MPMPRSSNPAVCVISERSVTGFGNVAGILNAVRYVLTSSSSCSLPCSYKLHHGRRGEQLRHGRDLEQRRIGIDARLRCRGWRSRNLSSARSDRFRRTRTPRPARAASPSRLRRSRRGSPASRRRRSSRLGACGVCIGVEAGVGGVDGPRRARLLPVGASRAERLRSVGASSAARSPPRPGSIAAHKPRSAASVSSSAILAQAAAAAVLRIASESTRTVRLFHTSASMPTVTLAIAVAPNTPA